MQWLKTNVATVVTWILLGLAAASTVGAHTANFETVRIDVGKIEKQATDNAEEIGVVKGDVRELKAKQGEIAQEVRGFRSAITDLQRIAARLEALVGVLKKGK